FIENYWRIINKPVPAPNGDVAYIIHTLEEISEQAKIVTREILTEKDLHLRNIIHSAPVSMLVLRGGDMIVDMINERMLGMIGKTDSIVGKPLLESIPELKGQPGFESFLQVYKTGTPEYGNEILVPLMRNGILEERYFNFAYTPVIENGNIVGVMDVATEVTEQVVARQQLELNNEELRFAIDLMPQMVWATKPDGFHDVYNKQWYTYTGLSLEETKGTGWNTVVHPDDREQTWQVWKHSLETGEPYQIEYRLRRYDGEYFWFLGRALPLKDASGAIVKWYGTCTDIDDQRKQSAILEEKVAERTQELLKTNQELARSNQNLEEFAHAASHDLKEPVRKIYFFTQKLKDQLKIHFTEAEEQSFNRIQNATERMGNLIDDLLLYS
ncbi:MAG: PAS domain S-box protein, partial [Chitinophagaceae bacterium]